MSKELEALDIIEQALKELEYLQEKTKAQENTIKMLMQENHKMKNEVKALEIIKEKGLSLNELWYIKQNEPWSVYIEKMREVYFDDLCVEDGKLKTQEEYELLKEELL